MLNKQLNTLKLESHFYAKRITPAKKFGKYGSILMLVIIHKKAVDRNEMTPPTKVR